MNVAHDQALVLARRLIQRQLEEEAHVAAGQEVALEPAQ
jgi:hypothetical protein